MLRKNYILLLLAAALFSCNNSSTPTAEEHRITDVPLAFSFISTLPPYEEDLATAVLKTLNTGSINHAAANHSDSVLVFKDAPNGDIPVYPDISFFPVQNKDTLIKVCKGSFKKREDLDSIATIDFSQYVTMVVTHPPSGNVSYYDILSQDQLPGDTAFLSLTSSPADASDGSSAIVNNYWNTRVYKVAKAHHQVLALAFRTDTTYYKLK